MRQSPRWLALAATLSVLAAGCATMVPPPELIEARSTFGRVSKGQAAVLKPGDVLEAKEQLERAEKSYVAEGDSEATRDSAYIATRKSLFAESSATTEANQKAQRASEVKAEQMRVFTLIATKNQLSNTQQALDVEQAARASAERRAALYVAALKKIGSVRTDNRGVVITLSGGVLFKTDKFALLPAAKTQLDEVAATLLKNSPEATITVGGHTDNEGGDVHNQELSEKRAQAVADYLVSKGLSKERVVARGFGEGSPIADNASGEGRAQNRRVEIVVGDQVVGTKQ